MSKDDKVMMWSGPVMLTYLHKAGDPVIHESKLRTDSFLGHMTDVLQVGRALCLLGESLEEGAAARMVRTSKVETIEKTDAYTYFISTMNSTYRLDLLAESEPNATN